MTDPTTPTTDTDEDELTDEQVADQLQSPESFLESLSDDSEQAHPLNRVQGHLRNAEQSLKGTPCVVDAYASLQEANDAMEDLKAMLDSQDANVP